MDDDVPYYLNLSMFTWFPENKQSHPNPRTWVSSRNLKGLVAIRYLDMQITNSIISRLILY